MKTKLQQFARLALQAGGFHWFTLAMLLLLTVQVQWGLWNSLDLPGTDEAWALVDGVNIANGNAVAFTWWKAPLQRLLYSAIYSVVHSLPATFYIQRFALTALSIVALYFLLCQLLPRSLAWAGAAWWAVSPFLADLTWDRTDFLAAAICAWVAVALLKTRSVKSFLMGAFAALFSLAFRPEYAVFIVAYLLCWLLPEIYNRLSFSWPQKFLALGVGLLGMAAAGSVLGIGLLTRLSLADSAFTNPGSYLVWVFANNRNSFSTQTEQEQTVQTVSSYEPLWIHFEQDYGQNHSPQAVLGHPASLARDVFRYALGLFAFIKRFTTYTVWAPLALRAERWTLGLLLLFGTGCYFFWRDWAKRWQTYFIQTGRAWLGLASILSLVCVLLVLGPFPVYSLVLAPLILAPISVLLVPILRSLIHRSREMTVVLMLGSVILAPNARAFTGEQPIRRLIGFFESQSTKGLTLNILGNASITICPYLSAAGQPCISQLWDNWIGYTSLQEYMTTRQYDYLIIDQSMSYTLQPQSDLAQVSAGQHPHWKLAFETGEYRVYKFQP